MAISLVPGQKANTIGVGAGASIAATMPAGVTAGNRIVVGVSCNDAGTVTGVTDDKSNTYVRELQFDDTVQIGRWLECWSAKNIGGSTAPTVTAVFSGTPTGRTIVITEYTGDDNTAGHEGTASAAGNSTNPSTGNLSPTPTVNGELIFVFGLNSLGDLTAGSGYTLLFTEAGEGTASEYQVQATAGPIAGVFVGGATTWACIAVSFKPASTGGGTSTLDSDYLIYQVVQP